MRCRWCAIRRRPAPTCQGIDGRWWPGCPTAKWRERSRNAAAVWARTDSEVAWIVVPSGTLQGCRPMPLVSRIRGDDGHSGDGHFHRITANSGPPAASQPVTSRWGICTRCFCRYKSTCAQARAGHSCQREGSPVQERTGPRLRSVGCQRMQKNGSLCVSAD